MLRELYIENLAVIEKADIRFTDDLNIFTGETGAGKSILINGINAALGQRVSRDVVRSGAKKAIVSAVFDGTDSLPDEVGELLSANGIDAEDCREELIIAREISADGKSTARINSRPVSVAVLRELGAMLVNVHGQHDNQALLSPEKHLDLLDSFAELGEMLENYRADFRQLQFVSREIKRLAQAKQETDEKNSRLSGIVSDINPLCLQPDEDEEIERKFKMSDMSRELAVTLASAIAQIYGDDDVGGASLEITQATERLLPYTDEFSDLEPILVRLESLRFDLDDIASELIRFSNSIDINADDFVNLSQRRDDIIILKRKYKTDVNGLISLCENAKKELSELENADDEIERLSEQKNSLLKQVSHKAAELSAMREKAGERFCSEVAKELEFLNMPNVKLQIAHSKGKLTVNGMDSIEMLISANAGEEPKPIAKIASGGELSRIMLALKNVIADRDNVPTLIFDEIDTGVSGRAAQKIGIKLHSIALHRQVICVTHLTQIAVQADNHILIDKSTENGRTVTSVTVLDHKGKVDEIARLLGGQTVTEITIKNAEELIAQAHSGSLDDLM